MEKFFDTLLKEEIPPFFIKPQCTQPLHSAPFCLCSHLASAVDWSLNWERVFLIIGVCPERQFWPEELQDLGII